MSSPPLQFLLLTLAGWMTRDQQRVTEYLLAENAALREQLRGRRLRYTDAQRRRPAHSGEEARTQSAQAARHFGHAPTRCCAGIDTWSRRNTTDPWTRQKPAAPHG